MSALQGCELYFDCFAGVAGDMTLGALLDLGVPEDVVRAELARLPLDGWRLTRERVQRGALMGTKIHVLVDGAPAPRHDQHAHEHHDHEHSHSHSHSHEHHDHDTRHPHDGQHPHTHYRDIRRMLDEHLTTDVKQRALQVFDRIAAVEARLHGVSVDEVAFHEVGAVDSIVDIVGAAAALAWLSPSRVTSRRVPLGGGMVDTAHGRLPVPAPATLELLAGADVEAGGDSELTTPTGAGILAAFAESYGSMPAMRVVAVGWGAGDRQLGDRPNLLRVVAGVALAHQEPRECVVIEANVDDMNPEWCEPLLASLFAAGALDAWLTPIVMKKGRPALTVGALCAAGDRDAVARALLRESTTLGVRFAPVTRQVLSRRSVTVETPWGPVAVKVAGEAEGLTNVAPEHEDCKRVAAAANVPIKQVYLAALTAFHRR